MAEKARRRGAAARSLREAEQRLRRSEARYRLLFERNVVGIFYSTLDGRALDCNDAFARILGYESPEAILAVPAEQLYNAPEDRRRYLEELRRNGVLMDYEIRLRRKDGTPLWVAENISLMPDETGAPNLIVGTLVDITERKQMGLALQASHTLLESLTRIQSRFLATTDAQAAFEDLLRVFLDTTRSEYGFIGEVLTAADGQPYLKTRAITNIAWNPQTRALYEQHALDGLEFRNVETLFGRVLTTNAPVIANSPANDPRRGGLPSGHPALQAFLGLPIRHQNQLVGVVSVANRPGGYDAALLRDLEPLATTCGTLIKAHRNEQRRQQAEEDLRESETRFRQFTENLPFIVWMSTPDKRRIWYLNAAYERIFGRPREAVYAEASAWLEAVHLEDRERIRAATLTKESQGTYLEEFRVVRPDGKVRWLLDRAIPIRDEQGQIYLHAGVAEDVTERRQAERALRESEERFRVIFEHATVGIARIGLDRRFLDANAKACEILGYSREELLTRTFADLTHPDDLESNLAWNRRMLAGEINHYSMEKRYVRKDGTSVWCHLDVGLVRDAAGQPNHLVSVVQDITQRKAAETALRQSEEAIRRIVETAPVAIVHIDAEEKVLSWNPAAERIFGWSAAEVLGRGLPIATPAQRTEFERRFDPDLRGVAGEGAEVRRYRKDGTQVDVAIWTTLQRDAAGRVTGSLGVVADITERKRLEEQLRQAQKMEAVGRLAGGIAHDFNNLLTAIQGFTELAARETPLESPLAGHLAEIRNAADSAANLTRQLLTFARKQILTPKTLNWNGIIHDAENLLRRLIGSDVHLAVSAAADLGNICADAGQMQQILFNLAANARDAMPHGGTLTIETRNVTGEPRAARPAQPNEAVRLTVRDTGLGVEPAARPHIFDPFFTTKQKGRGTGLGLATVHGIVQQNGGAIEWSSEPGQGTVFHIDLPRAPAAPAAAPAAVPPAEMPRGTETVLVVEDEPLVRGVATMTLRMLGYHVLEAAAGPDALRVARDYEGRIHVLFTDLAMPRMNGQELSEHLRRLRPETQVLYASGYSEQALPPSAEAAAFLPKPYTPTALARQVRELLDAALSPP